jgi:hypothetical protein
MKIFYDCEFIEDGRTIDLISIGMVREDGAEYYAVVQDDVLISRAYEHPWLLENVIPSLPVKLAGVGKFWDWDDFHADRLSLHTREIIARDVRAFILGVPDPQLWAWYGAYDHVALCQLWGSMISLPEGVPMWTNDLKQEAERLGNPGLPSLPGVTEHNALSDAREVRYRAEWLAATVPPGYGHRLP